MPIQIKVGADIQDAITGFKKVEAQAIQSTGRVTKNFTGLTRVVQDLPFGFTAISNNLEQLVPAAGSVGLAFSGVVAALTFAQIGFGNWTRGLGGLIGSTKQAKIALGDFKEVFENAAKASGDDIVRLEVFKQKLNDANTPASERLRILKEYNAVADKTNQVDATQINNLDLINQKIEAQNSLIIKRALSTAALSKITEAANKLIENEMKLQEELTKRGFKDLQDFEQQTSNVDQNSQRLKQTLHDLAAQKIFNPQGLPEAMKGLDGVVNPAQKAAQAVQQTDNNFTSLVNTVKKGRGELQNIAKSLSGLITVEGLTTQGVQDKTAKSNDDLKKLLEERRAIIIEFSKDFSNVGVPHLPDIPAEIVPVTKGTNEKLVEFFRQQLRDAMLAATRNVGPIPNEVSTNISKLPPIQMPLDIQVKLKSIDDFQAQLDALFKNINQTIQSVAADSFAGLGAALGNIISGGGIGDAFQSLFSFIGDSIASLGKQMIAMSPIIAALKLAIKSLNPALLLPAGIALVAIGSALRNIKPKGFAEGGLVFGPTIGLVGEGRGTTRNNPEVIAPLDKLKSFLAGSAVRSSGGGQLVARVSGRDLLFLLTQESNSQGRNFGRSSF